MCTNNDNNTRPHVNSLVTRIGARGRTLTLISQVVTCCGRGTRVRHVNRFVSHVNLRTFGTTMLNSLRKTPTRDGSRRPTIFLPNRNGSPRIRTPHLRTNTPVAPSAVVHSVIRACPGIMPMLRNVNVNYLNYPSTATRPL